MLGFVRNSQKLKRLYCTCTVLALLEIHLNSFYSHPVVAFFQIKSWYANLGLARSSFHNHFVPECKDALWRLRVSSGKHVRCRVTTLITENDKISRQVCYNSQSQDDVKHTIQDVIKTCSYFTDTPRTQQRTQCAICDENILLFFSSFFALVCVHALIQAKNMSGFNFRVKLTRNSYLLLSLTNTKINKKWCVMYYSLHNR